jgi:putative membrane-bound dehydrogenase-like protein
LKAFQVDPGLRVELVAAEPLTVAPCALAWDERGRLFVVENRGYPTGSPNGEPLGRIALLEDRDGDGTMDRRTDFAAGLTFPNGILSWDGGLIVTCAPDVLFLKDADGDGKAEIREVLLTGFDDKNTTQLRVSHPTLGPDGWIYLTSGWTGESTVRSPRHPERAPVKVRTDSRFHPRTLELEPLDGRAQFGQTFDDFGNRFICFNRVHIQHVVISSKHLQRNPAFAFSDTIQNVPERLVSDLIGGAHQNPAARIYPISDNITTADSHAGQFSAACAVTIYRGDGLPPEYYGDAFACDPTGNLVHRDKLRVAGATFSSRMANEGREFFASPDNWFRPVNLAGGPDGALYVCDLYRKTIEHPEYLPAEVRKRTDFDSGKDKGRIWRVIAEQPSHGRNGIGFPPDTVGKELVALLGHPNVWHRETARRILLERPDPETASLLVEQLPSISDGNPDAQSRMRAAADPPAPGPHLLRINALNTLFALGGGRRLDVAEADKEEIGRYFQEFFRNLFGEFDRKRADSFVAPLIRATLDESPGVRATAFRILDAFPGEGPELGSQFHFGWAEDPDPHARFQLTLFLGKCEYGSTFPALARIARRDGSDRWARAAVLSGLKGRANYFFETLMRQTNGTPAPELMRDLCRLDVSPMAAVLALTDPDGGERLFGVRAIRSSADAGWQLAGLAGLVEGFRSRPGPRGRSDSSAGSNPMPRLAEFTDKPFGSPAEWKADGRHLRALLDRAESLIMDPEQSPAVRDAAMTVLLHEREAESLPRILSLLGPDELPEFQQRVVRSLAMLPGGSAMRELLRADRWRTFSPGVRGFVLASMLSQPPHAAALLRSIEEGAFPLNELSRGHRDQLRRHRDPAVRAKAEQLLSTPAGDRLQAYEALKPVLQLQADGSRGSAIFKLHCASCHRLDREGAAVGPDLFGIRNQPKESILLHLVVPNFEVNPDFAAYEIETRDGRTLSGVVGSETATSVTIRQAQGIEETVRRQEIASMTAGGVSLMPEELETAMSRQELADLLAYLKGEQ